MSRKVKTNGSTALAKIATAPSALQITRADANARMKTRALELYHEARRSVTSVSVPSRPSTAAPIASTTPFSRTCSAPKRDSPRSRRDSNEQRDRR